MFFEGLIIGLCTFLIIGICHPIVIKTEYYFGTWPWCIYLLIGLCGVGGAVFIESTLWSSLSAITGFSFLWGILELFEQRERVRKGWFPMNPRRKDSYRPKQ
ncbi:MAG: DUF4491 family protein [Alloprevotella sp.]|nr:DUF4491 family protein [Alloprevotella sp.]